MCFIELNNHCFGATMEANAAGFLVFFANDADIPLFCASLGDIFKLACISFSFPSVTISLLCVIVLPRLEPVTRNLTSFVNCIVWTGASWNLGPEFTIISARVVFSARDTQKYGMLQRNTHSYFRWFLTALAGSPYGCLRKIVEWIWCKNGKMIVVM